MHYPDKELSRLVRAGMEEACKDFTVRIGPLGFRRTRSKWWTRRHEHTVDFIYFFRGGSSYGAPINASVDIRVHFGIRVLNDPYVPTALNGPFSDAGGLRSGRYHLRFNARSGSMFERCTDDLVRFVVEQGEPWFQRFRTAEALLRLPDSPLKPRERESLRAAQEGRIDVGNVAASLKDLGIKEAQSRTRD